MTTNTYNERRLRWDGWSQGRIYGMANNYCKESWKAQRMLGVTFVLDTQLYQWAFQLYKQPCLRKLEERSSMGGEVCRRLSQPWKYKSWTTKKINFEESNCLELVSIHLFLPGDLDAQCCNGEHAGTGNGNQICNVIQLCTAIAVRCLWF